MASAKIGLREVELVDTSHMSKQTNLYEENAANASHTYTLRELPYNASTTHSTTPPPPPCPRIFSLLSPTKQPQIPSPLLLLPPTKIPRLHIPRHTRQPYPHAIDLLRHLHLAPEPRRLGEPEGEVQHVVFVVGGFGHGVVVFGGFDDEVAGRAGAGAAAGACWVGERFSVGVGRGGGEMDAGRWGGKHWADGPSISRSSAWAMSMRLSPAEASKVCSAPSLSMKVTCSLYHASAPELSSIPIWNIAHSSPGFGGVVCPC